MVGLFDNNGDIRRPKARLDTVEANLQYEPAQDL